MITPVRKDLPLLNSYSIFSITFSWYISTCIFILVISEYVAQIQGCEVLESQKLNLIYHIPNRRVQHISAHGTLPIKTCLISYLTIQTTKSKGHSG